MDLGVPRSSRGGGTIFLIPGRTTVEIIDDLHFPMFDELATICCNWVAVFKNAVIQLIRESNKGRSI